MANLSSVCICTPSLWGLPNKGVQKRLVVDFVRTTCLLCVEMCEGKQDVVQHCLYPSLTSDLFNPHPFIQQHIHKNKSCCYP